MFKLLFKYLIPMAFLLIVGVVAYNYYYGDDQEKQNSQKIISQVKGLGNDVVNLLLSEKDKFQNGKYNDAMDKIGSGITYLREQATKLIGGGQQFSDRLSELDQEKRELEQQLKSLNDGSAMTESGGQSIQNTGLPTAEQIEAKIRNLADQIEQLGNAINESQ